MKSMAVVVACVFASTLVFGQNVKEKTGFMVSPTGLATTNEATKGDQPRKVLVNCTYEENGNVISECALPEGVTLTDLVREFEARDTKRVMECGQERLKTEKEHRAEIDKLKAKQ